ncbi:hypothetical protein NQ314_017033 [Rhamnusium bicolor]|uniref:Large subunit GTPase 1 homolog n=1 Tax=Rhamnusium bicolor TaxID=1586634 RepID=A0AAV8WUK2_9CUCU|nr:hypothetical protein NQ314_017033 [Rhamnusium bicolor]
MLHTTEIQDGYDWGRLNLQSVTEESSFQEFLSTAELTGTEFQAEKLNIKFVNPNSNVGLLTGEEMKKAKNDSEGLWPNYKKNKEILLTPYEKNLQFWRQLWRVVERSDVVIQIVDTRNPDYSAGGTIEERENDSVNERVTGKDEMGDSQSQVLSMRYEEKETKLIMNALNKIMRKMVVTMTIHNGFKVTKNITTIGLVSYPNVGKSSTINTLLSSKKVSVPATRGKTKAFPNIILGERHSLVRLFLD